MVDTAVSIELIVKMPGARSNGGNEVWAPGRGRPPRKCARSCGSS